MSVVFFENTIMANSYLELGQSTLTPNIQQHIDPGNEKLGGRHPVVFITK